jgi:hypothetical protein
VAGVLEVQAGDEKLAVEAEVDQQADGGTRAEGTVAEEAERQHRFPRAPLPRHEGHGQQGGDREPADDHGCAPGTGPRLDQGERQRGQGADRGRLCGQVEPPAAVPGGPRDVPGGQQQVGQADRHVDEEDQPPAHGLGEHAADGRPGGRRDPRDAAPDPYGAGPRPGLVVGGAQQRERARHENGGRGALDKPGRDQGARPGRQAAGGRGRHEQAQPGAEDPVGAETVAE